jgi:hypothetical protein
MIPAMIASTRLRPSSIWACRLINIAVMGVSATKQGASSGADVFFDLPIFVQIEGGLNVCRVIVGQTGNDDHDVRFPRPARIFF